MKFGKWIDTFIEEKGIDTEFVFEVEGKSGEVNFIPVGCVIDYVKAFPPCHENFKNKVVGIDFVNGDVMDFFKHCAKGMAY